MACCGGNHTLRVTKHVVSVGGAKPPTKQVIIKKNKPSQVASLERQLLVVRPKCQKCGYPTMVVHIANRERIQCTNANCRAIQ